MQTGMPVKTNVFSGSCEKKAKFQLIADLMVDHSKIWEQIRWRSQKFWLGRGGTKHKSTEFFTWKKKSKHKIETDGGGWTAPVAPQATPMSRLCKTVGYLLLSRILYFVVNFQSGKKYLVRDCFYEYCWALLMGEGQWRNSWRHFGSPHCSVL